MVAVTHKRFIKVIFLEGPLILPILSSHQFNEQTGEDHGSYHYNTKILFSEEGLNDKHSNNHTKHTNKLNEDRLMTCTITHMAPWQ